MILTFISLLSLIVFSSLAEDYCSPGLCPQSEPHIACHNDGRFSRACPGDAKLLTIDGRAQKAAVQAHNNVRQKWASGQGVLNRPACRMATIKWDNSLARLAELNVKQCVMEHDCHNTAKYRSSGQNLFTQSSTGKTGSVSTILKQAVQEWESEGLNIDNDSLNAYPQDDSDPIIGHFTVLVNEVNMAVGCAVSQYSEGAFTTVLVACNYAATNIINEPVYESCSEPASKCSTGTNSKYAALCSSSEQYELY